CIPAPATASAYQAQSSTPYCAITSYGAGVPPASQFRYGLSEQGSFRLRQGCFGGRFIGWEGLSCRLLPQLVAFHFRATRLGSARSIVADLDHSGVGRCSTQTGEPMSWSSASPCGP